MSTQPYWNEPRVPYDFIRPEPTPKSRTKLHNEQDAIKQAVEAGYARFDFNYDEDTPAEKIASDLDGMFKFEIMADPAFWRALGKARCWIDHGEFVPDRASDYQIGTVTFYGDEWMFYALRYFETRLSNGDMKAFWQSLP